MTFYGTLKNYVGILQNTYSERVLMYLYPGGQPMKPHKTWNIYVTPIAVTIGIIVLASMGKMLSSRQTAATPPASTPIPSETNVSTTASSMVDPGTSLDGRPAPAFTLTDQAGKRVSLSQFRGKVVVLAFVDSQCTTICPLTTSSMTAALKLLGPSAASNVQLLGIDANPQAISTADVKSYTELHGLTGQWHFLTGSLSALKAVWHNYYIYSAVVNHQIDHTPALYVIDPQGHERVIYMTPMQYGVVGVQANILASAIAKYLPSGVRAVIPAATNKLSQLSPTQTISLSGLPGTANTKPITILPNEHTLYFFTASWTPDLKAEIAQLNQFAAKEKGLQVVVVDVASTEPTSESFASSIKGAATTHLLVGVDKTGDVADAFAVQDMPWLTLTNGRGKVAWHHDGWVSPSALTAAINAVPN